MKDRVSTKILSNGATRYGVYDEEGNLLRYEYIKLEDEPSTTGDLFNKANMLPDTIPSLLGLKMANPQVKDALNVLANVANLHVWKRTQVLSEAVPAVPAGYTLGEIEEDVEWIKINTAASGNYNAAVYCISVVFASTVSVNANGEIQFPSSSTISIGGNSVSTLNANIGSTGTFILVYSIGRADVDTSGIASPARYDVVYAPANSTVTRRVDSASGTTSLVFSALQRVTGYAATPEIPAGMYVDYLTSTDEEAYRESSNGADAYYTLGAKQTLTFDYNTSYATRQASAISVDDDGTISATWSTINYSISSSTGGTTVSPTVSGVFFSPGDGSGLVYWLPSDTVCSGTRTSSGYSLSYTNAQLVTGHAAVPDNTTIEYLGQLGAAMRGEAVSYVGTGTYGVDNPISIEGNQKIKFIKYLGCLYSQNNYFYSSGTSTTNTDIMIAETLTTSYVKTRGLGDRSYAYGKKSADGKVFSWYGSGDSQHGLNESGATYYLLVVYEL